MATVNLVDIHGQHAWQSLTRAEAVRGLLDAYAGVDATAAASLWSDWRQARKALESAAERQNTLQQESERLAWQIGELDKLQPQPGEWEDINAQHGRLANAQGLMDAAREAAAVLDDEDSSAASLIHRALSALQAQAHLGQRRAQFVRRIGGQGTLHVQGLAQAHQQLVDAVAHGPQFLRIGAT